MRLAELIEYAKQKYHISVQNKLVGVLSYYTLCHPRTGKWVAVLFQQYDSETGEMIERCDLRCGYATASNLNQFWIEEPFQMKGQDWIGISFTFQTEKILVCRLFDQAIKFMNPSGYTIVLDQNKRAAQSSYKDTLIPFAQGTYRPRSEVLQPRLKKLIRMFSYSRHSPKARSREFFEQAKLMKDYTDDAPWTGSFFAFFPTYQDLTTSQLRGYFSWRTHVRHGEYLPIPASAACIYIYELLNGIGVSSAEEALQKMKEFEKGYLDSGFGDKTIRTNLHRWMADIIIMNSLSPDLLHGLIDPEILQTDIAFAAMRNPEEYTNEQVYSALLRMGGKSIANSPVITEYHERGIHLFCDTWRKTAHSLSGGKDQFTQCFGKPVQWRWLPLSNAVYLPQDYSKDSDYVLNAVRSYHCRNNTWYVECYESVNIDKERFRGFLHETDRLLRKYLKTGRMLKEKPEEQWADPYINAVIEEDRKAQIEASRPKININLSQLDQIRSDSLITRDSLLTEEERQEMEELQKNEMDQSSEKPDINTVSPAEPENQNAGQITAVAVNETTAEVPLNSVQIQILNLLLHDEDPTTLIRNHHLTPALVADQINEAMFDEFGDTILSCEDDQLAIVEDYREDIARLLGGKE